jgi:hypothetical protein
MEHTVCVRMDIMLQHMLACVYQCATTKGSANIAEARHANVRHGWHALAGKCELTRPDSGVRLGWYHLSVGGVTAHEVFLIVTHTPGPHP